VRLFTEAYLKGKASFTSDPRDGTTFTVSFPLVPPAPFTAGA
jgi:signal transduction histidine kinase